MSPEVSPLLESTLSINKGFEPGFDSAFALGSLLDELQYLRDQDYLPLRKNCLLGVCAAFEEFSKTFAAALSYEPNWQQMTVSQGRLTQNTSSNFEERYRDEDSSWRKGYGLFLLKKFPWLVQPDIQGIEEVFWLRNQIAHNAGCANGDKSLNFCRIRFRPGEKIALDGHLLVACIDILRKAVNSISDPTPYLEAI